MKPRLARPLLVTAVSAALIAGGVTVTGPAVAAPAPVPAADTATDEPVNPPSPEPTTPEPSTPTPTPPVEPSPSGPVIDPSDPVPTDPGVDPSTEPTAEPTVSTVPTVEPTISTPPTVTTPPIVTTSPVPPTTAPVDRTAPLGAFRLSAQSLWIGQKTSLTQVGIADNGVADPATVTRLVTWGDGTPGTTLARGGTAYAHQYNRTGKFTVRLTLTDRAGNRTVKTGTVAVVTPGKVKISKSAVWHGEVFTVSFSSVPSGTTGITLDVGDGVKVKLPGRNQSVPNIYWLYAGNNKPVKPGVQTVKVIYANKNGATTPITVGRVAVKNDRWNPTVSITKPKRAERISSWSTVRGTAGDKGSGVDAVSVLALRTTGSKRYCYTANKSWQRVTTENLPDRCYVWVRAVKGKWSLKLKGLQKGTLYVDAVSFDWASRTSKVAWVEKKLTRS